MERNQVQNVEMKRIYEYKIIMEARVEGTMEQGNRTNIKLQKPNRSTLEK